MGGKGKEAAQRVLSIIVIIAMMTAMGIQPPVIVFFAIVIYFVWRAVQHTERQETNRIFDFYVSANDILRDEDRRWYGFEVAAVTNEGERILREMPDAPPLVLYALGALYHRVGDYAGAQEHLARLVETQAGDENHRLTGSPELRRYVEILRRLERDPAEKPQTMAAVRALERARRHQSNSLLENARALSGSSHAAQGQARPHEIRPVDQTPTLLTYLSTVNAPAGDAANSEEIAPQSPSRFADRKTIAPADGGSSSAHHIHAPGEPRPPISEVLRDVYEEKKTA